MIRALALLGALCLAGPAMARPAVTHGAEDAAQRHAVLSLVTCGHCVDLHAALVERDMPATARDAAAQLHAALTEGRLALDVHVVLTDRRDLWAALLIGCRADAVEAHRRLMLTEETWRTVTFAHPENGFVVIPEDRSQRVMRAAEPRPAERRGFRRLPVRPVARRGGGRGLDGHATAGRGAPAARRNPGLSGGDRRRPAGTADRVDPAGPGRRSGGAVNAGSRQRPAPFRRTRCDLIQINAPAWPRPRR